MKNLLASAILLASIVCHGQNCFGIYQVSNDTSVVGDSAWVGIATAYTGALTDTLYLQINIGCSKLPYLAKPTIGEFKSYKKYYHHVDDNAHNFHTDSLTKLSFIIHKPCVFGQATYYLGFANPGTCSISGTYSIIIKDSTHVNNGGTGIHIFSERNEIIDTEYYDLTGRSLGITKPEMPGIYIQRSKQKSKLIAIL